MIEGHTGPQDASPLAFINYCTLRAKVLTFLAALLVGLRILLLTMINEEEECFLSVADLFVAVGVHQKRRCFVAIACSFMRIRVRNEATNFFLPVRIFWKLEGVHRWEKLFLFCLSGFLIL